jgi:hypothetical protein
VLVFVQVVGLVGLVGGLRAGGAACLKHVVLRLWLTRNGSTPWNYVWFLDHAAERILLRKVGGGYVFLHRMLLEHLATRWIETSAGGATLAGTSSIGVESCVARPRQRAEGRRTEGLGRREGLWQTWVVGFMIAVNS